MNRFKSGFSLLETVIFLCIISILLGIAGLAFTHRSPRHYLDKAAWEIYSRMNQARFRAILEHRKVRFSFTENSYIMEEFIFESGEWKEFQRSTLEEVRIDANNSPVFHPRGTVSNLTSVYVSNIAGRFRISLAMSGRLKVIPL
jgi:Tfp pilus assembly protein FimT